jgi:hypothetical protein
MNYAKYNNDAESIDTEDLVIFYGIPMFCNSYSMLLMGEYKSRYAKNE